MMVRIRHPEKLVYPESDGEPMGESTLHIQWVMALFNGLEANFVNDANVFIASNLFWYPVHGDPTTVTAPDVMVVFGRPKGHRLSYKQWEEANIGPQVVFEVRSPSNTQLDLAARLDFFTEFGVEEYYLYDPADEKFVVRQRSGEKLATVAKVNGYVSPRMRIRFEMPAKGPMRVFGSNGERFMTYLELLAQHHRGLELAEELQRRAADERRRAESLAAKLRALGVDPDAD